MDFFTLNAAKRYADEAMEGAGTIQGEKGEKGETGEKGADGVIPTPEYIEFYSDDDGYLTIGGIYGRLIDLGSAYLWVLYGGFETVGTTNINPIKFTSDIINSDKVIMGHGLLQFTETQYADGKGTVTNMRYVAMSLTKTGFKISLFNQQESGMTLQGNVVLLKK